MINEQIVNNLQADYTTNSVISEIPPGGSLSEAHKSHLMLKYGIEPDGLDFISSVSV